MERLEKLRACFKDWKIDTLIIESPNNRRWLSGFTGSAGTLIISADRALLMTDFRYWGQAEEQAPDFELIKHDRARNHPQIVDLLGLLGTTMLGIESDHVNITQYRKLRRDLRDTEIEIIPLRETAESLRHIKSEAELETLRKAAAITDLAMGQVNQIAKVGMTEKQLAWQLERIMRENGADGLAFDIIVAAGPNAARAHHRPSDRPLQEGDSIVIDMGAMLDGYHSDMTRSFYVGNEPSAEFRHIFDLVHTAQKNALENMKAGMSGKEIDALTRDVIEDAGQGENYGHSTGHGVGLFIHEGPRLSSTNENVIPAGCVVTVEPGVYLEEWGGIRIEDLVLVTEDGIEFLSHCPKNPIIPIR